MSTTTTTSTQTITASNVSSLFPDVSTRLVGAPSPTNNTAHINGTTAHTDDPTDTSLSGYDAEQIRLMDEICIVLDANDVPIGTASKKTCHLMSNIDAGLLHRAFSVFLFDPSSKKLLLQQRAAEKITFPNMWTNTCCSHPLAHPAEAGEGADLVKNVEGAKRAAVRKLGHELGIDAGSVPVEGMRFLTRIHYLAESDGRWGEHEIDYILFTEAEVEVKENKNEVRDTRWVSQEELREMFEKGETGKGGEVQYTPWFRLICEGMLFEWWDALKEGRLGEYVGEEQIRRM